MQERITEWIPPEALAPPDGQGYLALTFRKDDPRFLALRRLCVRAVAFVGAGVGRADSCTVAGVDALRHCEVCLFDALAPVALLELLPPGAQAIDVGKRGQKYSCSREDRLGRLILGGAERSWARPGDGSRTATRTRKSR